MRPPLGGATDDNEGVSPLMVMHLSLPSLGTFKKCSNPFLSPIAQKATLSSRQKKGSDTESSSCPR